MKARTPHGFPHGFLYRPGIRAALTMAAALLCMCPLAGTGTARAQVTVLVAPPTVEFSFGAPLVYVDPGLWVLPDSDVEVMFSGGWYWSRHYGVWYRSRVPRGRWVRVAPRYVPAAVVRVPSGHYRHWHAPPNARFRHPRHSGHGRPVHVRQGGGRSGGDGWHGRGGGKHGGRGGKHGGRGHGRGKGHGGQRR